MTIIISKTEHLLTDLFIKGVFQFRDIMSPTCQFICHFVYAIDGCQSGQVVLPVFILKNFKQSYKRFVEGPRWSTITSPTWTSKKPTTRSSYQVYRTWKLVDQLKTSLVQLMTNKVCKKPDTITKDRWLHTTTKTVTILNNFGTLLGCFLISSVNSGSCNKTI